MNISIITATYNSGKTINSCIDSVLAQTAQPFEHVFIDGLSRDNTLELIGKKDAGSIIVSERDHGIYDAMNKGLAMVKGDIIGILNSDDVYADETILEKVLDMFEHSKCDALYGDLVYVKKNNLNQILRHWRAGEYKEGAFLYGWMPPHPTFFVKREVYEKFGVFDTSLGSAADYELMLRLIHKFKIKVAYLPYVMVKMRTGGKSNRNLFNRFKGNWEDRKAWKLNALKPRWYTLILKPLRKLNQYVKHF
ncbi:MAG: glycosyltransferase family 2 protein [Chitinophagaceae bacterium]